MRILMLTNTYTPIIGGVERSITSFTAEYKKHGHEVLIVTLEFDSIPKDEKGVIRVPAVRHFNGSDFSVRLPIPTNLRKVLDNFKPDIVHSHHPFMLGDTALRIANQFQVPLVFTHHTKYEDYTHYVPGDSRALKKFVVELTTGYAELVDYVFAPSKSIFDLLRERGVQTPMDVVPTGIDIEQFAKGDGVLFREKYGIPKNAFLIGHVGRLAPEKNLKFLSQAVLDFMRNKSHAFFLLVGKGPLSEDIKTLFTQAGLQARLCMTGALQGQGLIDAYHGMNTFAFASKTETQGMVLVEAMAAGLPVVALEASGVREVVLDQMNGRVLPQESREHFVEALQWIFNRSHEEYQKLKNSALETAQRFSIKKTAIKALKIYETLKCKEFVYSDVEHSLWSKTLIKIKTEWDLASNVADAVGAIFRKDEDNFRVKFKRWLNINEWSARILGLPQSEHTETSPGLVLIQIDGLAKNQLNKAIQGGRMPFLQKLLKKQQYHLHSFYSGQPSSTPGVQGELFYGVKGIVPSFSFLDHRTNKIFKMFHIDPAVEIEQRLRQQGEGLLKEGSSYSNIFSGGAKETHFCAVDLGWDKIWRNKKPLKLFLLRFINFLTILRTELRIVLELIFSLGDFVAGLLSGNDVIKEIKFIPTRLAICILLRDLITFGAGIDIVRGLPVIHVNFLGYDEHAHRRGPSSRFAHGTLKGIDRCIAKIYREALGSSRRKYDVWIYSDHGQEEVLSYFRVHKKTVHETVENVFKDIQLQENYIHNYDTKGIQSHRARLLGDRVFKRISPFKAGNQCAVKMQRLIVTAMGPIGHIYLPRPLTDQEKRRLASQLVTSAKIPLVLTTDGPNRVKAYNESGEFDLPQQAGEVFGSNHPYLKEITQDIIHTCHHPNAGTFTISGWKPSGKSYSFPSENGAHGGPGSEETNAFALLPCDIDPLSQESFVRATDLREAALNFLNRSEYKQTSFLHQNLKAQNLQTHP